MQSALAGKNVVLGVTGSIACYKALDLASKLVQAGANVETILSYGATQFVTPLAFRSLTHRPVVTDTFDPNSEQSVEHVALARWADIVVIAPATVHCIAKLAAGLADDPLTTTVIATEAPLLIAPAMDANMYDHPATRENVARLQTRGVFFAGPAPGRLASGLMGVGRLVEPADLLGHIAAALGKRGDLAGRKVIVSAGGTQEAIDPVRVITNHSSGRMGYAVAEAARDRGAEVVLVAAPTALPDPPLDSGWPQCAPPGKCATPSSPRPPTPTPSSWPPPSPTTAPPSPPSRKSRKPPPMKCPSTWRKPPTFSPPPSVISSASASPPRAKTSKPTPPTRSAASPSTSSLPTTSPRRAAASARTPTASSSSTASSRWNACPSSPSTRSAHRILDRVAALLRA